MKIVHQTWDFAAKTQTQLIFRVRRSPQATTAVLTGQNNLVFYNLEKTNPLDLGTSY